MARPLARPLAATTATLTGRPMAARWPAFGRSAYRALTAQIGSDESARADVTPVLRHYVFSFFKQSATALTARNTGNEVARWRNRNDEDEYGAKGLSEAR